jgi:dihydrodipicolinate synthase/N-acetylneuraminate lyase
MKIKLKKQINCRFGVTLPKGRVYEATEMAGNRYQVQINDMMTAILTKSNITIVKENKFDLDKIAAVGELVADHSSNGGYTCLLMGLFVGREAREIYSDLFDVHGHALETIIEDCLKEKYTYEEYRNLRLMLVAMFYEIARRENKGENILPES